MNIRYGGRFGVTLVVAFVGLLPGPIPSRAGASPARNAGCPDNAAQHEGIRTLTSGSVAPWVPAEMGDVAALSARDIWIAGDAQQPNPPPATTPLSSTVSLIEHWDGRRWCVAANTVRLGLTFRRIAAPTSTAIWALADSFTGTHAMLERWDGRRWSVVPLPVAHPVRGYGSDRLAASSARNVWIVWNRQAGSTGVQRWDGGHWHAADAGLDDGTFHTFTALATRSAADTWAAMINPADSSGPPALLHWDGHRWSQSTLPQAEDPLREITIETFALLSASDVWAVGVYERGGGRLSGGPVAYHWDGKAWSEAAVPNDPLAAGGGNAIGWGLRTLVVLSPTSILAMGNGGPGHPVRWDGRRWSLLPVATDPGAPVDEPWISGMSALSATDIWAVGRIGPRVAVHWDGKHWHAIPIVPAG